MLHIFRGLGRLTIVIVLGGHHVGETTLNRTLAFHRNCTIFFPWGSGQYH